MIEIELLEIPIPTLEQARAFSEEARELFADEANAKKSLFVGVMCGTIEMLVQEREHIIVTSNPPPPRETVREPIGPARKQQAVDWESTAGVLEAMADEVPADNHLRRYVLRAIACEYRMRALWVRQIPSREIAVAIHAASHEVAVIQAARRGAAN